jgi:hypothetical protein
MMTCPSYDIRVTFRPMPMMRVETGNSASRRAPFRYSVSSGPRTFEIRTLAGRSPRMSGRATTRVSDIAKAITA